MGAVARDGGCDRRLVPAGLNRPAAGRAGNENARQCRAPDGEGSRLAACPWAGRSCRDYFLAAADAVAAAGLASAGLASAFLAGAAEAAAAAGLASAFGASAAKEPTANREAIRAARILFMINSLGEVD